MMAQPGITEESLGLGWHPHRGEGTGMGIGMGTDAQGGSGSPDANRADSVIEGLLACVGDMLRHTVDHVAVIPASRDAQSILEAVFRTHLVRNLVDILRLQSSVISPSAIAAIMHTLSELVLTSSKFLSQFVDCRGLETIDDMPQHVFGEHRTPASSEDISAASETLTCGLQIASHFARNSEKYYSLLYSIFSAQKLAWILTQSNVTARAKCCNLIGNLCRHSSRFYTVLAHAVQVQVAPSGLGDSASRQKMRTTSVLAILISRCADDDAATRKFACFAVGNAAFHSSELYAHLSPSIVPLGIAMDDSDEKTRANAAGAIGNLVRNGGELAATMAASGVPEKLLKSILVETDLNPQRIFLFSLGTMAVYGPCRERILACASPSVTEAIKITRDTNKDETVLKYVSRLKQKLKQPLQ
jgi:fused-like protein